MQKRVAAVVVTAAALLAAGAAQPRLSTPTGPLGLVSDGTTSSLVRLNAKNLRPVGGQRLDLGAFAVSWAYSPDRATLALALNGASQCPDASLRFVAAATLAPLGDVALGHGYVATADWLAPERLIVRVGDCDSAASELVVVDTSVRRVLSRSPVQSGFIRRGGDRLAILAGNRLTIIDAVGTARTVVLDRIDGGALALTPDGRRAFVASSTGVIADVDTSTLAVAYHGPLGDVSSSRRYAEVLPTGELGLAGSREVHYIDSAQNRTRLVGTGLVLVDSSTWTAKRIDYSSSRFTVAGNTILATGAAWGGGGYYVVIGRPSPQPPGDGLAAYAASGALRFHRFKDRDARVAKVYGHRAFVYVGGNEPLKVVDIRTGKLRGTRAFATLPWILQGSSSTG